MPSESVDVVILGAGAAGLAAARELSHAGVRVSVVEARSRIGGRILTLRDAASPLPVELGAEFIHGEAPETLAIAEAAGLMVVELPDLHEIAYGGRITRLRDFWESVLDLSRHLARRLGRARGGDFPVGQYLATAGLPARRRALLEDFVQGFHAALPERLSARALAAEAKASGDGDGRERKQFRVVNGSDALVRWLRDGLDPERSEIRLSTVAERIEWRPGGVRVTCRAADGMRLDPVEARAAIVTLPHAVLKAGGLGFEPALPVKQRALHGLDTGQIFKIVLRFRRAFWDGADFLSARRVAGNGAAAQGLNFLHAPGADVPTWWTSAPLRAPVLTGWAGGRRAEALLSEQPATQAARSLAALAATLRVPRRELEELLEGWASHDWRADPYARGAYAYVAVGGTGASRALARPVAGTLFFAGEATNDEQIGTVAGAIASGRRAARAVRRIIR